MSPSGEIFLAAVLAALGCGLGGVFLVLKRSSMLADAITHAILPGLVLGFWIAQGPNLVAGFLGALIAAGVAIGAIHLLSRSRRIKPDAAIGVVFPTMFALGVVLISLFFSNVHLDTDAILYGELTFVPFERFEYAGYDIGPTSFMIFSLILLMQIAFHLVFMKDMKITVFDAVSATVLGISPAIMSAVYLSLLAITAVGAFSAVGAIMAVALLVIPAATARLLTSNLGPLIAISLAVAATGALLGCWIAFALDLSISGSIATILGLQFGLCLLIAPKKGILARTISQNEVRNLFYAEVLVEHLANHEQAPDRSFECGVAHIRAVFGWTDAKIKKTIQFAVAKGWLEVEGDQLLLTDKGRKHAGKRRQQEQRAATEPAVA